MQIHQPISFEIDGKLMFGLVHEIFPNKSGVVARTIVDGQEQMFTVDKPHKVSHQELIQSGCELGQKMMAAAKQIADQAKAQNNLKAAKQSAAVEVAAQSAFDKAMAELDSPSEVDLIHLSGMGYPKGFVWVDTKPTK